MFFEENLKSRDYTLRCQLEMFIAKFILSYLDILQLNIHPKNVKQLSLILGFLLILGHNPPGNPQPTLRFLYLINIMYTKTRCTTA